MARLGPVAIMPWFASRQQVEQANLSYVTNPLNPNYTQWLGDATRVLGGAGDAVTTPLAVLYQQLQRQANMLAFLDVFRTLMAKDAKPGEISAKGKQAAPAKGKGKKTRPTNRSARRGADWKKKSDK